MARKYIFETDLEAGDCGLQEDEQVRVTYSASPGRPATPPSYAFGGDPPEPPEVEITGVFFWRQGQWEEVRSTELSAKVEEHILDCYQDRLLENASEEDEAEREYQLELRRDADYIGAANDDDGWD